MRRQTSPRNWYLLLIPLAAALLVVEVYPLAETLYFSLMDRSTGSFVGLANYAQMVSSGGFWGAVLTSLSYSIGSTVLALGAGILLAFQLSQLKKRRWLLECVFVAPLAVSPLVVGVVFAPAGIWDDLNGFWHNVLGQPYFNVATPGFFFPSMILSEAWEWAPLLMLVALAVMSNVLKEIYEAATIHGASTWQTFMRISLPTILRSPAMQFIVAIRFIDAMRAFEIPYAWSSWVNFPAAGSPTDTLSLLLFKLLFNPAYGYPLGYVSAIAVTLVAMTLLVTTTLFKLMRGAAKF